MSVVSAGGRRGPPRERGQLPQRDFRSIPKTRRGYSQSDIGEPFIPRFSAVASEVRLVSKFEYFAIVGC